MTTKPRTRVPVLLLLVLAWLAAGCAGGELRTETLAPIARTQVYGLVEGDRRALDAFCAVDTSPLDWTPQTPFGTELDQGVVGYESTDDTGDPVRRRCRIDRGWHYHTAVWFDLADLPTPPPGRLVAAAISGTATLDPANTCTPGRDVPIAGVCVDCIGGPPEPDEDRLDRGQTYPDIDYFGTVMTFGEAMLIKGEEHVNPRLGRAPEFSYPYSAEQLEFLRGELATSRAQPSVLLLAARNPDWEGDRTCVTRLDDLVLELVFQAAP